MGKREQSHVAAGKCGVIYKGRPPCGLRAGWGTAHPGDGPCRKHGGNTTGAPKGNKNARKSGRYETILFDTLEPDEVRFAEQARLRGELEHINDQIALGVVRERRMLQRIAALKAAGDKTEVEETIEAIAAGEAGEFVIPPAVAANLSVDDLDEVRAIAASGGTDLPDSIAAELDSEDVDALVEALAAAAGKGVTKRKTKRLGTLGQIQAIESDLTAVQAQIAKWAKDKHQIQLDLAKFEHEKKQAGQPLKLEHSGPDGGPMQVEHGLSDEQRAASALALFDRARTRGAGSAAGPDEPVAAP